MSYSPYVHSINLLVEEKTKKRMTTRNLVFAIYIVSSITLVFTYSKIELENSILLGILSLILFLFLILYRIENEEIYDLNSKIIDAILSDKEKEKLQMQLIVEAKLKEKVIEETLKKEEIKLNEELNKDINLTTLEMEF